jgi:hypothetical protein
MIEDDRGHSCACPHDRSDAVLEQNLDAVLAREVGEHPPVLWIRQTILQQFFGETGHGFGPAQSM